MEEGRTREQVEAITLANRVLDRVNADPDDDLAILARQLLRGHEESMALRAALELVEKENTRLSELLWGSRCVYCGEIIGKEQQNQEIADAVLRQHVWNCEKHPLQMVKQQLAQAQARIAALEGKP